MNSNDHGNDKRRSIMIHQIQGSDSETSASEEVSWLQWRIFLVAPMILTFLVDASHDVFKVQEKEVPSGNDNMACLKYDRYVMCR